MFFTSQIFSEQQHNERLSLVDERLGLEKVYQAALLKVWARVHWSQWESLAYVHICHILLRGSESWLLKQNGMTSCTGFSVFFPHSEEEKGCIDGKICYHTYRWLGLWPQEAWRLMQRLPGDKIP